MKLIECVPNFSEGRRPEVVDAIRDAIAAVNGVTVLDISSDASHNRSVITFVVPMEHAVDAAFAGIREAASRIDLTSHTGEHPRIGAADVVPFVPLEDTTMDDCVALSRELGERVGSQLHIPVYLYERAATRPTRVNLADVRRGQFEGLRDELGKNPDRDPDFGPSTIHPTAGAIAIGARPFLVAYNVYIGGAEYLPLAKSIAKGVRESSGGFKHVKGLGLEVEGQAQVSMNLVDTEQTPLHVPFDYIAEKSREGGADVTWSEIVGLVPERVLFESARHYLKLDRFTADQVLERQVSQTMRAAASGAAPPSARVDHLRSQASHGDTFLDAVASSDPAPGGGSVAAYTGALAAALARMVAGLTIGRKRYAAVEGEFAVIASSAEALMQRLSGLVRRDADAYSAVAAAYKLPKDGDAASRTAAIDTALLDAAEVPLETARACVEVAALSATAAAKGNSNAVSDAGVAALLAEAGCRAAAYNVLINVKSLSDPARGRHLARETESLIARVRELSAQASDAVDAALAG